MEQLNKIENTLYTMELQRKEALKKIYDAINIFLPFIENTTFSGNPMMLAGKLPKIMKIVKENETPLKEVFNKEFFENIKKLV